MFDFDNKLKEQMDIAKTSPRAEEKKRDYERIWATIERNDAWFLTEAFSLFKRFIMEAYPIFVFSLIEKDRDDLYKKGKDHTILSGNFHYCSTGEEGADFVFNGIDTLKSQALTYVGIFVAFNDLIENFLKRNNIGQLNKREVGQRTISFSATYDQFKQAYLMELQLLEKSQQDINAIIEDYYPVPKAK